jgi:undecaprenyl-diphosphatase
MTAIQQKPIRDRIVRTGGDAVLIAAGLGVLVLSSLPVHTHSISAAERSVFHVINAHTVLPFIVVWLVMQLGNIIVVPVAALVAAAFRRWRLAASILVGGLATYELAKVIKKIVVRGRRTALMTSGSVAPRRWVAATFPDTLPSSPCWSCCVGHISAAALG